jgi:hypothetical protein
MFRLLPELLPPLIVIHDEHLDEPSRLGLGARDQRVRDVTRAAHTRWSGGGGGGGAESGGVRGGRGGSGDGRRRVQHMLLVLMLLLGILRHAADRSHRIVIVHAVDDVVVRHLLVLLLRRRRHGMHVSHRGVLASTAARLILPFLSRFFLPLLFFLPVRIRRDGEGLAMRVDDTVHAVACVKRHPAVRIAHDVAVVVAVTVRRIRSRIRRGGWNEEEQTTSDSYQIDSCARIRTLASSD